MHYTLYFTAENAERYETLSISLDMHFLAIALYASLALGGLGGEELTALFH